MRRRTATAPVLVSVLLAGLVLAGCSRPDPLAKLPPPPTTVPVAPATTIPDHSGVELSSVPGRTTTTLRLGPGAATLQGSVIGPEGPVSGATVRLERLVGDSAVTGQFATGPDGAFTIPGILGGRYRVRAYRPSDLTLVKPEIFFLEATEVRKLVLNLARYDGVAVETAVAPSPPIVDEPANVVVQVSTRTVDAEGIVRDTPVPDAEVELFATGQWAVEGRNSTLTDSGGRASWLVRCRAEGRQPLTVVIGSSTSAPLDVPPCAAAPPPPTAPEPGATTTTPTTTR